MHLGVEVISFFQQKVDNGAPLHFTVTQDLVERHYTCQTRSEQ